MDNGFIKLHRKLLKSDMYENLTSKQRDVMINCLSHANHKERRWEWKGEIHKCKPGQFKSSLSKIKKACARDVSIRNIRTALLKLEKWGFLTNQSTKSGRIISIRDWEKDQSKPTKELTKSRQRGDKEVTTNKNIKNIKNIKKKKKKYKKKEESSLFFSFKEKKWKGITEERIKIWEEAYPACDIQQELSQMKAWLIENPEKKKVRYGPFIIRWLKRSQDKGGTKQTKSKKKYNPVSGQWEEPGKWEEVNFDD